MKKEHSERHHFHEPGEREQALPLTVVASGSSRWYGTERFDRTHTGFWGIELVTMGSAVFRQDSHEYRVETGGVFFLRPGSANSYGCGPEGILHKRYLQIRGAAADRLFECCGLHGTDTLHLDRSQCLQAAAILKRIHASCARWTSESSDRVSAEAYALLLVLADAVGRRETTHAYVAAAREWTQRMLSTGAGVADCAAHLGITATHLNRLMRAKAGCSTKQYILSQKMAIAANLLRETNSSVAAVAAQVGFEDPLYFSHAFRRRHGRSPAQYRRWIRTART